ncbi:hypothetical protein PHAVU_004G082400 [Phaseolus vulgaris]|uniref:WPP domain-associated protein n=1 Tax=Phaseolus vulgaris TaxID=3885 RepID=V7C119_PHAVU|nr:hypothetical protein PHAVU_004G082400g [Phaseolus vulgaris]ESW23862.1 hypothetical protein PHAVU_004G082400g [Phaseolus vulgaris]
MEGVFGCMDGRYDDVSLADSTMMWIVHYAMNKAQEKMKGKTGVLERLNEISKFYELAVMQLEGCLSIVHAETESSFLESNHEEVLDDLRDIKDRLQWRLKESELAIVEKDKELTQRLENELQLRHALELKERQLVALGVSHEVETSSSNAENEQTTRNEHKDGGGDDGFSELRTGEDQQKLEPQHDMFSKVQDNGVGRKKVEEMGSDIDILKQTMDLAFGKMQSALFLCEMRPKEREWKLAIEKDVMSISIGSSIRNFQENIEGQVKKDENHVVKVWKEQWPRLMNEFTSLQHEFSSFYDTYPEDSDCSSLSSPAKPSSPTRPSSPEGSHEMPNKSSQKVEETEKFAEDEENEDGSKYVAKLIKSHESIIRRKSEELNLSKHGILQERKASYSRRRKELNRVKERIHVVTEKLDNFIYRNVKLSENLFKQRCIHDTEPFTLRKLSEVDEIHTSEVAESQRSAEEKVKEICDAENKIQEELSLIAEEFNTDQILKSKNVSGSIDDRAEEFNKKIFNFELEKQIQEHVCKYYLREVINEWTENIEKQTIERKIRDDINLIFMSEAANQEFSLIKGHVREAKESCLQCSNEVDKKINSTISEDICMFIFRKTMDEFNKKMVVCQVDSAITEQIHQIVFGETLKNFVNIASFASKEHREDRKNFLDQLRFMSVESFLKEDVCMVVFKLMLEEWGWELDDYYMENYIREKVNQVVMVETLNDAFFLTMEVNSLVHQENTIEDSCSTSSIMLNQVWTAQGEENLTIILLESLLSCFEAEENLMLSAKCEIKEQCRQLDLGSERGDLHEHEIFEDLITGEEETFSSLTTKVEHVLQQLGISKALLRQLGTSLGHSLRDSYSFQNQMSNNEEGQLKLSSSAFMPLLNLLLTFAEFGAMICQKFEMMTVRLEKMKDCLDPLIELVGCFRSKELLYQKAFIKRCQNLQKAEAEVDLLGDQVDALITLLEKIFATLHQHAPALQQFFEVYDILELIKRELISGSVESVTGVVS